MVWPTSKAGGKNHELKDDDSKAETSENTESSLDEDPLLAYGRSKEKRSDGLLVSMALVLDASEFPTQVELFQGNISESKIPARDIEKLKHNVPPSP